MLAKNAFASGGSQMQALDHRITKKKCGEILKLIAIKFQSRPLRWGRTSVRLGELA